jgi:meso-butanediol dehydrogenase / (S,S)-butanediol dehydrogenase / diacetyl reductase
VGALDGKVAVVTGAASGMGRATTLRFAREGAAVVAVDISGAEKDTASEDADRIAPFHADVTVADDVEAMIEEAVSRFGRLDALCNVAGVAETSARIVDLPEADWDRVVDIDMKGVFLGMKYGIRAMIQAGDGGAVVNWSSVGGLGGPSMLPSPPAYKAAKAGVINLTRLAAVEYGEHGIRTNCICPGFILTPMAEHGLRTRPNDIEPFFRKSPLNRAGRPEEVAAAALWLCTEEASFVNGVVLPIDGGWMARQP